MCFNSLGFGHYMHRRLHYFIVYRARGAEFFGGGSENALDYIVYKGKGKATLFNEGNT